MATATLNGHNKTKVSHQAPIKIVPPTAAHDVITFTSGRAKAATLLKFWPVGGLNGRFVELKVEALKIITTLPEGEMGFITPSGSLSTSELKGALHAVRLWVTRAYKDKKWAIDWSPIKKKFLVARRKDVPYLNLP